MMKLMLDNLIRFCYRKPVGTVAINMRPVSGPWGGSSAFVDQLARFLAQRNYKVQFNLKGLVDVIVLIDPRDDLESKAFGIDEIEAYRREHPCIRILHRINECDQRKATHFMDDLLAKANRMADHTVFISKWLRDYHAAKWFDVSRPHTVIYNGADPGVFHPIGHIPFNGQEPLRLVTHHWSDNVLKGFDVYQQVDRLIANGELPDTELWVIGRWPAEASWRVAKLFPPLCGATLAARLRECHVYLTASLWEPCGMHHVEGAQCGLPLVYHEDGGGIVEAGVKYGIGFREDVRAAIVHARTRYHELLQRVLEQMPSGDRMCLECTRIIQKLVYESLISDKRHRHRGSNPGAL